ncbi:hypothetical protein [Brumimicrobium salinarum]|nr:hypothetical protein [Brumimicrobium salinarum]
MKIIGSLISILLILSHIIGLTNNLMPRCKSEFEHHDHVISLHVNHFHPNSYTPAEHQHIGHEEHDDETNIINILQHIFDDLDNPKENCEFGFFANIHKTPVDVKLLAVIAVFKHPQFFLPTLESPKAYFEYVRPNYTPPDKEAQQQRGPPHFLV